MTEAMQMTVSSEMENRMDDSNSTEARSVRGPQLTFMPSVETVICEIGPDVGSRVRSDKSAKKTKRRTFIGKTALGVIDFVGVGSIKRLASQAKPFAQRKPAM
ncbi:hypothetical protein LP414_09960 [Polaromonas sp. P1(28)-13]|nr:hypothetical protein LP414_09960 [Polaromonas sp. P1(28)-13]